VQWDFSRAAVVKDGALSGSIVARHLCNVNREILEEICE
jgi:hypothetical protein